MELYQQQSNRTELGRAALGYSAKGIPVFPCKPAPDKSPLTKRGFYDATTDRSRITGYWNSNPHASIGMPTGERSGFFVLDEDRPGALDELEEKMGKLPPTLTIRTPRGGRHLYFRYGAGITNRTGYLPEGIDVRGEGGYALVPPSTGYTVEYGAPVAEPPEWLLEALREPQKPESGSGEAPNPTLVPAVGETIPDGKRNVTLTSIAGKYHDGTRSRDQLATLLLDINSHQCLTPLEDAEVERIATSIHRREPCKRSTQKAGPEVLETLAGIEDTMTAQAWPGMGWKTARSVMVVLIKEARRHGTRIPSGVRVSIGTRSLALAAGVSHRTLLRASKRLRLAGRIRRDDADRSGTEAGAFVLACRASCHHSPTRLGPQREKEVSSGDSLRAPFSAPRLRWSAPRFDRVGDEMVRSTVRRMGKTAEAAVDFLEAAGGELELEDLAAALRVKRPRDLRRRAIARLEEAAVVKCSGDTVRLTADWLDALNRERELAGEISAMRRDMARYEREREAFRNPDAEPEDAPTEKEMEERRENAPDRRRAGVEQALVHLFRQYPEYRGRRVGQITCGLIMRGLVPENFPREVGLGGAPKDAEVASILEDNGVEVAM